MRHKKKPAPAPPKEAFEAPDEKKRVIEVRGRGDKWKVFYPAEENYASPLPVYDREGKLKETVWVSDPTNKMIEVHQSFMNQQDAIEYAEFLNPDAEVKVTETTDRAMALEAAREAKRAKALEAEDEE